MACPDCTMGGLLNGEPTGIISTQGAYFARAPGNTESTEGTDNPEFKRAVLLLTDAFGLPLKNSKIIADNLAIQLKCDVWIPDYFAGLLCPLIIWPPPPPAGVKMGFLEWMRIIFILIKSIPGFIRNRSSIVDERLAKFIRAIQEEKKYTKIGAVGYCFGGATAVRIDSAHLIHSAVVCHPGPFTLEQVKAIKIPTAWVCAQEDMFFSDSLRDQAEAEFARRQGSDTFVDYEFKVYKGTTHGFATRPNLDIPEIKEAYQKAFEQTVDWFEKTLVI
ncbi:dienelactone hydrolase endo-1,3,1,4-beta-D-glucanase [Collybia nuda]|uniref:Dienelactone hydrolase endo-1,3,1,4-beta-D-glucanase n=1 Tax=Collybia nuda TaxID=64659 RepID=A0A9P5YBR5_9AGAR|nr:dienelactone hydrolase endo-1,3,1,4-beta-D-glucanase [Collybia nuda]